MDTETRMLNERKDKIKELKAQGINPYPYKFEKTAFAEEIKKVYAHLKHEEKDTMRDVVKVAGRLVSKRVMGKASFAHILDDSGSIQLYLRQDELGEEPYKLFKKADLGDFIGIEGSVFRTKFGELTIDAKHFHHLSKALRPLPEKFHGLKDPELRYRKRYLDLIANPEVKKVFVARSKIIKEIRDFLVEKGYLEVETPALQPQYGGAAARPFLTKHNALNMDLYLRISPELYLKRLLIGGFEKVFDINKNFRNEGVDFDHNPEFTMIEWYEAYADYNHMMDMCEEMFKRIAKNIFGRTSFKFREMDIELGHKWERISMVDALHKYGKVDVEKMEDLDLYDLANQHDYEGDERDRGHLINYLFEKLVEDHLVNPTFIIDHPVEVSPLTKAHRNKEGFVERAELFMGKTELANIYSELNDPEEQRTRLEEQEAARAKDEEHNYPMDDDFCEALEYGMPPAGGIGVGVDRMVMIMTESPSIREIILFPTMKTHKETEGAEEGKQEKPVDSE